MTEGGWERSRSNRKESSLKESGKFFGESEVSVDAEGMWNNE
jgi:hypothetical protein